jgi:putative membrane protein
MVGYPNPTEPRLFWRDAFAWSQSVTSVVLPHVFIFGGIGALVGLLHRVSEWEGIEATHVSFAGGALALLLVLRTNGGYERWWEARRLWGGIVNQSRNVVIKALAYVDDMDARASIVKLTIAFAHACRETLRGERDLVATHALLTADEGARVRVAEHAPSAIAHLLARIFEDARRRGKLSDFGFVQLDREVSLLIDHLGGCERILRTPMPRVHTIKLRRFILLYLLGLPFAVASSSVFTSAFVTMLVSYPMLGIDRIGQELENPFSPERASHLPLDAICQTIEKNLRSLQVMDLTSRAPAEANTDEGAPTSNA